MSHSVQLPARGWYPDPAGVPQRLRSWNGRYWGDATWAPDERIATHRLPKRVREGGITGVFVLWLIGLPVGAVLTMASAFGAGMSGSNMDAAMWLVGSLFALVLIGLSAVILVGSRRPTASPPSGPGVRLEDVMANVRGRRH